MALAIGVSFSLLGGLPAFAQSESEAIQIQQLRNKLEERDAVINDLRQRVDRLERQSGKAPAQTTTAKKKPPTTAAVPPTYPVPTAKPMQPPPPSSPPAQTGTKTAPGAKPAAPG